MRLNSLRMVKRINLVGLPLENDIFLRKESRLSRPGEKFSMTEATSSKPLVIQFIHAWSVCDTTSATYGHGKMYLMEMLNRVSEVHNVPSIVIDRDVPADEVGFAGLFCLIFLVGVELKRIHWHHYVIQGVWQWWQNQIRLCHNDCLRLSLWHTTSGCVFTLMALSRQMDRSRQCDQDAEPEKVLYSSSGVCARQQ